MRAIVIADDTTGANDCGAQFAQYGLNSVMLLDPSKESFTEHDVVIVDTDSRAIPADEAYQRLHQLGLSLKNRSYDIWYKKIDSTVRGNLGAEIDALYHALRPDLVVVAPAYPDNGRVIRQGELYVHGQLLEQSDMAKDMKTPLTGSNVVQLLQGQTEYTVGHIDMSMIQQGQEVIAEQLPRLLHQSIPYVVFDAVTSEDLYQISQAVRSKDLNALWVGSAGLAHELLSTFGLGETDQIGAFESNDSPAIVVAGSLREITRKQINKVLQEHAMSEGIIVQVGQLMNDKHRLQEIDRVIRASEQAYRKGKDIVIYTSDTEATSENIRDLAQRTAHTLGAVTAELAQRLSFSGFICTGGDTARQVFTHMKLSGIQLLGELAPGIPIGRMLNASGSYVITKAGGFGEEDTLLQAIKRIKGDESI